MNWSNPLFIGLCEEIALPSLGAKSWKNSDSNFESNFHCHKRGSSELLSKLVSEFFHNFAPQLIQAISSQSPIIRYLAEKQRFSLTKLFSIQLIRLFLKLLQLPFYRTLWKNCLNALRSEIVEKFRRQLWKQFSLPQTRIKWQWL